MEALIHQITILSFFFWLLQITDLPAAPLHGHPLHTVLTRLWGCTAVCLIRIIPLPPAADLIKTASFFMRFIFPGSACSIKRRPSFCPSTPASALFYVHPDACFIIIITCIISSSMKKIFREPILSFLEAEEDEREMKGKLPVRKTLAKTGNLCYSEPAAQAICPSAAASFHSFSSLWMEKPSVSGFFARIYHTARSRTFCRAESDHSPRYSAPERNNTP